MKKVKYLPLALIFLVSATQAQYQKVLVDSIKNAKTKKKK